MSGSKPKPGGRREMRKMGFSKARNPEAKSTARKVLKELHKKGKLR
jgi:hypothetical protein